LKTFLFNNNINIYLNNIKKSRIICIELKLFNKIKKTLMNFNN